MNKLLQRQLRKYYGKPADIPPEWKPMLEAVDRAYDDFDDDRRKLERSIDLSSDELWNANAQLIDHASQIEAAYKELEAFSYSVSHDLRAPLRHINGFVDLLVNHSTQKLDERDRYYLNIIADASKHMGRLIDDLLAFSRMSRTEMQRIRIATQPMVHEVIKDALLPEFEKRSVAWKIGPLPEVEADPAMLRQVWANLIDNALKYTRPRDQAEIEIGCQSPQNGSGELVFFIRDNGVGFDMQYADKLFGVFQRLHRVEDFEGTGIGLAHVRRIIARQGGRTWADGKKDSGATFYFSLPAPSIPRKENHAPRQTHSPR